MYIYVIASSQLDKVNRISIRPLQNLRRISLFTEPRILPEVYTAMKNMIATSPKLESAEVLVVVGPRNGSTAYLGAIRIWDSFRPDPSFRKLTLRFFLPHRGADSYGEFNDYFHTEFRTPLASVMQGQMHPISLINQGKVDRRGRAHYCV